MQQASKWGFIINPVAGNGFAASIMEQVKAKARQHKLDFDIKQTQYHKHERELAHEFAVQGCDHIIAVGGDGTFNQVVTGLLDNDHQVTVGVIPAGSGNDITPILGFNERFNAQDWDMFFARNTIMMDVGSCNGNFFINGLGLGIDAEIAESKFNTAAENKEKSKSYLMHILRILVSFKEKAVSIIHNDEEKDTFCFIHTIGNGRRFGGGYMLTPKAIANDGTFDVCSVKRLSLMERLALFARVPSGTHIKSKKVEYYNTDRMLLQFNEELPYHLDGELYYDNQFMINILPGKLNVIYNPNGKHYFNEE